jgi:hypothetical protein
VLDSFRKGDQSQVLEIYLSNYSISLFLWSVVMRMRLLVVGMAASLLVSGCSIRPLPEDVTGVNTYHIVRQIRCEAREKLIRTVISYMEYMAAEHPNIEVFARLASQYTSNRESIRSFNYNLFKGKDLAEVRSTVKTFYDAGIAYNFELTMTEDNNLSTEVDFIRPIVNPKFTLALTGGANRRRVNDRTFTITDTFGGLLKLPEDYCQGFIVGPNYIYPIAGRIGMDAMVADFVELTLFGNLSGSKASTGGAANANASTDMPAGASPAGTKPAGSGTKPAGTGAKESPAPPTLADKLTFTTSLTGGVNPVATFAPVGRNFQVSGASLTGLADRIDMHQVTVGLAISPTDLNELGSLRSYLFSPTRLAAFYAQPAPYALSSVVVGNRVIGGGTPAEKLALIAVDQFKSREFELVQSP